MLTPQSVLISIAFAVMLIVFVLNNIVPSKTSARDKMVIGLFVLMVVVPLMILKVFVLHCMTYGDCNTLAWLIAGVAAVLSIIYLVAFLTRVTTKRKQDDEEIQRILQPLSSL